MDFDLYLHNLLGLDGTLVGGSWFFLYLDGMWPLVMLSAHLARILRNLPLCFIGATMVILICQALSLTPLELESRKSHSAEVLVYISGYAIALYIFVCEWLMRCGAKMLTSKRGDRWPKEMDCLALTLATFGIFATIKIGAANFEHRPSTLGVILLTSALVLHLIKTRSEVNDWNKPGANLQS